MMHFLTKRSCDVASWQKVNWAIPKHKEPTEQAQLDKLNETKWTVQPATSSPASPATGPSQGLLLPSASVKRK